MLRIGGVLYPTSYAHLSPPARLANRKPLDLAVVINPGTPPHGSGVRLKY